MVHAFETDPLYSNALYVTLWVFGQIPTQQAYNYLVSLRKHAYSNIKKISPPKPENFQIKISDNFHISAQNIDCRYSLELPR